MENYGESTKANLMFMLAIYVGVLYNDYNAKLPYYVVLSGL